ncbi:MAG: hypothetical protein ACFFER_13205 [Candidatus Thorarchaeota archaeon]
MRVALASESYLIAKRGLLKSDELCKGDDILGIDSSGNRSFERVISANITRNLRWIQQVNTDRGTLLVNAAQPIWTDKGAQKTSDMMEALTDDYSGTKLEGHTTLKDLNRIRDPKELEVNPEDAYLVGIATRRIWTNDSRFIIRIPGEIKQESISRIVTRLRRTRVIRSKEIKRIEGEFWDWIQFDTYSEPLDESAKWRFLKKVPKGVRVSGMQTIKSFIEGCFDVRRVDDSADYGFDEKDLFIFSIFALPLAITNEFHVTPKPLYAPTEFAVDFSKGGYGRVRSVVPCPGMTIELQFRNCDWDPFVNGFLVRPF